MIEFAWFAGIVVYVAAGAAFLAVRRLRVALFTGAVILLGFWLGYSMGSLHEVQQIEERTAYMTGRILHVHERDGRFVLIGDPQAIRRLERNQRMLADWIPVLRAIRATDLEGLAEME